MLLNPMKTSFGLRRILERFVACAPARAQHRRSKRTKCSLKTSHLLQNAKTHTKRRATSSLKTPKRQNAKTHAPSKLHFARRGEQWQRLRSRATGPRPAVTQHGGESTRDEQLHSQVRAAPLDCQPKCVPPVVQHRKVACYWVGIGNGTHILPLCHQ